MTVAPLTADDLDEALVANLHRLGVRHLVRLRPGTTFEPLGSEELIAGLAVHVQARFRTALILLFLRRPSLSAAVPAAIESLPKPAADTLRLYYQAAVYLRPELEADLHQYSDDVAPLPDLFSAELGLPAPGAVSIAESLVALGELHRRLSGRAYDWAGSYRHYLPLFLRQLKLSGRADYSA